ncbi:sigma 54-interacting transcriptional regulator, partial [Fusobacterium ulcerans]|uniref:sigma 54-interacting transcriptional regulator n=1 Tax=Fusobacterium ulcerans TaxID=861 RepID=UPI0026F303B5
RFEAAEGGTLFLDEIGDMPLSLQVKLLRVLQEKTISPVGSDKVKEIDIRIIAATNKNLEALVAEGKFREDLYYRLNVFPIDIPPLRERPKDIEDLTNFFIAKYSQLFNIPIRRLSNEVMSLFLSYSWPGNIRELKNITEYIINVLEERDLMITVKHLPPKLTNSLNIKEIKTLAEIEKEAIESLLLKYGRSSKDKIKVAKTLDISLATLYRKLKLYGL